MDFAALPTLLISPQRFDLIFRRYHFAFLTGRHEYILGFKHTTNRKKYIFYGDNNNSREKKKRTTVPTTIYSYTYKIYLLFIGIYIRVSG